MLENKKDSGSEASDLSRRNFLRGVLAAATVVGFDLKLGSWATAQDLAGAPDLASGFPTFDGELRTDEASLSAAADDYGHIIHRRPVAVLRPGSIEDVVKLVRFARENGIQVAGRGQGHCTFGQNQAEAGVVIDMATLAAVHEINAGDALVGAGLRWIDLLRQTIPLGVAPPVLTDYIELSIGGTLSVGGVGAQAFRTGPQVDNVLELGVVTGRGEYVVCSPSENRPLFDAVRAGLGQFGIIVQARIRLVPAPPLTRFYELRYADFAAFMADLTTLVDDGRFDTVQGFAATTETGGYLYTIEATEGFAPGGEPDDAALLAGLSFVPGEESVRDMPYFDYLNRLEPLVTFLRQIGVWSFPHPWIDLFLPEAHAERFIGETLASLDPADMGQGPILIYPYRGEPFQAPFLRVPPGERFFLFDLLRTAVPPTPERAAELVEQNRRLFERARLLGGFQYPVGAVPRTQADWIRHYGPLWPAFFAAKREFDPDNVLTPGQGVFPAR
jgi:cytokinin dehydrogenase